MGNKLWAGFMAMKDRDKQNEKLKPAALRPAVFTFLDSLRNQLFLSFALLSSAILIFVAWAINHQVVQQARAQVQTEVGALLPLYDAILNERARRLATLSATMAGSPIIKTVFGDERAARDQNTLRQMFADVSQDFAAELDLALISGGAWEGRPAARPRNGCTGLQRLQTAP